MNRKFNYFLAFAASLVISTSPAIFSSCSDDDDDTKKELNENGSEGNGENNGSNQEGGENANDGSEGNGENNGGGNQEGGENTNNGSEGNGENNEVNKPNGKLPGKFSVSDSKQVQFAQGNLQYQVSTKIWRFAENQYDVLGTNSSTNKDWIDIFGWGTSGCLGKDPTMKSTTNSDYGNGNRDIAGTMYDWGVYNKISNGGNEVGQWRTLTKDEWEYVFNERKNAKHLRSQATVCKICGYLLLPDGFECPDDLEFYAQSGDFTINKYSEEQWSRLESAGAVFLPCAFTYNGYLVGSVGSDGGYWSSSAYGSNRAYYVRFSSGDARVSDGSGSRDRNYGCSVRLATE